MSIRSYKDVKVLEYEQSQIFLSVSRELMGRVGDVREMLYGTPEGVLGWDVPLGPWNP